MARISSSVPLYHFVITDSEDATLPDNLPQETWWRYLGETDEGNGRGFKFEVAAVFRERFRELVDRHFRRFAQMESVATH